MQHTYLETKTDKIGRLVVRDNVTAKVWEARKHSLSICYQDMKTGEVIKTSASNKLNCKVQRISKSKSETCFHYDYKNVGISFDVEYSFADDSVILNMPIGGVKERVKRYRLISITPLPRFGRVKTGQDGYMFLPNYCGSIKRFDGKHNHTQRSIIYGPGSSSQHNPTVMPVFGIVHKHSAFLGIIQSGQFDAELVAEAKQTGYNTAYVRFCFRQEGTDVIDEVDRTIRYCFLSGEDAGYVGMAKKYRSYLLQDKKLVPIKKRAENNKVLQYYCEAYSDFRLSLGKKYTAGSSVKNDGEGEFQIRLTFDQAQRVVKLLKDAGIEKATIILVGWTNDGADGLYPTKLPPDKRLGGDKELKNLIKYAKSLGYQIVSWDNYTDSYEISPDWNPEDISKNRDGTLQTPGWYWAGGLAYKLCPEKGLEIAKRNLPAIKKKGFEGGYLTDAMPVALKPCFDKNHRHVPTRRNTADGYRQISSLVRKTFGVCHVENSHDFMADSCDAISRIPTRAIAPADGKQKAFYECFLSEFVPFYQIAYHGIIQYHLYPPYDSEDAFLNELEYGAKPRFEVSFAGEGCGEDWQVKWLPLIKQQYKVLCKELGYLQMEFIDNHKRLSRHVSKTRYSDGTIIIVNYGKSDYSYCGKTVPGKWFLRIPPENKK